MSRYFIYFPSSLQLFFPSSLHPLIRSSVHPCNLQHFNPLTRHPFNPSNLQHLNPSTCHPFNTLTLKPFKPSSLQSFIHLSSQPLIRHLFILLSLKPYTLHTPQPTNPHSILHHPPSTLFLRNFASVKSVLSQKVLVQNFVACSYKYGCYVHL